MPSKGTPSFKVRAEYKSPPGNGLPDAETHARAVAEIAKQTRRLLAVDGVIEDALSAVLEAAKREFHCRIVVRQPAQLVIDGGDFIWPLKQEG